MTGLLIYFFSSVFSRLTSFVGCLFSLTNRMARALLPILLVVAVASLVSALKASEGNADPTYKACVQLCEKTGCVGEKCFQHCKFSSDGKPIDGPWYMQEPLYLRWKQWDCQTGCQYECMIVREAERTKSGEKPIKYHNKWPFKRVYGLQEPVSVALSALNLAIQFHGWVSFFILVYYKLPMRPDKKTYYEYTGLMHIYGLLAMNSMFWSGVFLSRDVDLTERLDYTSAAALVGFSFILAIVRAFSIRDKASRTMVAAPLVAFFAIHVLYLNFYYLDSDLHKKVSLAIGAAELLVWVFWAGLMSHPSRWKLWAFIAGSIVSMALEACDFPPYYGYIDSQALWRATSIFLACLWWSFVRDDAEFRTSALLKKNK